MVTGAGGMLGTAIREVYSDNSDTLWTDLVPFEANHIEGLDVRDWKEVSRRVRDFKPDMMFHLAAETNVDLCESEPDHAFESNAFATENIARVCHSIGCTVVYISTGNVFDGRKKTPYTEYDVPGPINVYGQSKLAGEKVVSESLSDYFIIRAGWMVGGWEIDKKFVYKIIQLCQTDDEIRAVNDKFGSPTFTIDFARNLPAVLAAGRPGLYHMVNRNGTCSRFEIAEQIIDALGVGDRVKLLPVLSDAFPLPAERPDSEMLRNLKLDLIGVDNMPDWKVSLRKYILSHKRES